MVIEEAYSFSLRRRAMRRRHENSGYSSISPFIDKKAFEYAYNLINSSYLKIKTDGVWEFLSNILDSELIASVVKEFVKDNIFNTKIKKNLSDVDFNDYRDLNTVLSKSNIQKIITDKIAPIIKVKRKTLRKMTATDNKLLKLGKIFNLNETELNIIAFIYCVESSPNLEDSFSSRSTGAIDNLTSKVIFINSSHKIIGCSKLDIIRGFKRGNLCKCELLDLGKGYLSLEDWLIGYLSGIDNSSLAQEFCKKYKGKSINIDNHLIDEKEKEIVVDLFRHKRGSVNILLYGETGTGKTEFTKTISDTVKKDLFIVNNKKNEETSNLKRAIMATVNITDPKSSIILVDEADSLLNTGFSFFFFGEKNNKSWINTFLDESKHKIIWITNNSGNIEPSVMRRFAFSMKFKRFNVAKKLKVFKYVIQQHGLENYFSEEELKTLCRKYSINAGGITDAIKNLRIKQNSNKKAVLEKLHIVFKNHETAVTGKETKINKMKEMGEYSLKALNTSENPDSVISILRNFCGIKKNKGNRAPSNINLLLYGQPGTGKTEFVKYLARVLDKELVLKRGSDLISCWVGETEKLIARAFEEAEENEAILFLDEVDSFLYPRKDARHSWEMTQTNELLTQMENLKGILICATNFKKGLDEASLRRFKLKIEFKPLTPEGNLEIYNCILASYVKAELTEVETNKIKSLKNLTPGEFHILADKFLLIDDNISHQQLINSLEEEIKHKPNAGKIIGFGGDQ